MALKYTGQAKQLIIGDKMYVDAETYKANPKAYAGSFDSPIPISQEDAIRLINSSNLHTFETAKGDDLEEKITAPSVAEPMNEGRK